MASSTLTGDRRWSTARKSGMTVLGKVPKPINLPSQRLENHGLDPNVEIVPKGTLTWGTRPSSATTNAWASPAVSSPRTDGSTGSPVNGRPSSGGSGPRPSTAGSDRSYELASSAWGPNSRPSSASGIVASNQASLAATRPRSAETRPGSSQMSRFAESIGESNVAWGPPKTTDSMGSASSRASEFMLSSGDFPTLGSDKSSELHGQRGHSSQGRPSSASGRSSIQKELLEPPRGDGMSETYSDFRSANSWKNDNYHYAGGNAPPSMEGWQNDPQHGKGYSSGNIPPHQFDTWRGPPVHPPDAVCYSSGTAGGPYRPPGRPGSYPAEPFGYYPPQLPVRPLPNTQSSLRPVSGPGGFYSKNGDMYHPHVSPESYMVPGHPIIPIRPGVYQGPPRYDGYYGPRAGFVGGMDREVANTGISAAASSYDQYFRNAHVDPANCHKNQGAHALVAGKDEVKCDETDETCQGQLKILLKQHDGREDENAREKKEEFAAGGARLRVNQHEAGKQERTWKGNSRSERMTFAKPATGETLSHCASEQEDHPAEAGVFDAPKDSSEVASEIVARKLGNADIQSHGLQQCPVITKNAALIGKIETLNSKARTVDIHGEIGSLSSKEKTKETENPHGDVPKKLAFNNATLSEGASKFAEVTVVPHQADASLGKKIQEKSVVTGSSGLQVIAASKSHSLEDGKKVYPQVRKDLHGLQTRVDHHAKSGFSSQDDDELVKKSTGKDASVNANLTNVDDSATCVDSRPSQEIADKQVLHDTADNRSVSHETHSIESFDDKTQRAKLKEIAAQRARQLQKEEEERTREQKAKALAKLEELNRRSLAPTLNQKLDGNIHVQHKDSAANTALETDSTIIETSGGNSVENSGTLNMSDDSLIKGFGDASGPASNIVPQESKPAVQGSAMPDEKALSLEQEMRGTEEATQKANSNFHERNFPKNKQMGYRRRQNSSQEKHQVEQPIAAGSGNPKGSGEVTVQASTNSSLSNHEEPLMQHKKKNNRSTRNKSKLEEAPLSSILPSPVEIKVDVEKVSTDVDSIKPLESTTEVTSVPSQILEETVGSESSGEVTVTPSTQVWPHAHGGPHGRVNNQWKPNPPRRSTRNHQAIRSADKFHVNESVIWAPVKQADKSAQSEEVSESCKAEVRSDTPPVKNGSDPQSGMKTKRAEMERYVPKPVAKELSHQENTEKHSLSSQGTCDTSGKPDSGLSTPAEGNLGTLAGGPDFTADSKNGEDNRSHKRGKMHASWRQRGSAGSHSVSQCSHDGSVSSDPSKFVQHLSNQHQSSTVDALPEGQLKPDNQKTTGENLLPSEPVSVAVVKDQGVSSKQKNQRFKVHRGPGSNSALASNKDLQSVTIDKHDVHLPAVNIESDGRIGLRHENKNAGVEQPRSHWQPKSQAPSYSQRQGNKGSTGQRVASQTKAADKESTPKSMENQVFGGDDKDSSNRRAYVAEIKNAAHQEVMSERNIIAEPLHPTNAELDANVDTEQVPAFPAMRRHGQHNGRFNRGQGASYRGGGPKDLVQDGRQNPYFSGGKQKNGTHYGYQQVGSHNKPSDLTQQSDVVSEEVQEVPRVSGSSHRERGQNHSRRGGHFFGRGSGPMVRVGDHFSGEE